MATKKRKLCDEHLLLVSHNAEKGRVTIFCGWCGWKRWMKAPPCDRKKQKIPFPAASPADYREAIAVYER